MFGGKSFVTVFVTVIFLQYEMSAASITEKPERTIVEAEIKTTEQTPIPVNTGTEKQQSPSSFDASKISHFKIIMDSFQTLPQGVLDEIKTFVSYIIPKIPKENPIRHHLNNGLFLINMFDKVVSNVLNNNTNIKGFDPKLIKEAQKAITDIQEEVMAVEDFTSDAITHAPDHEITTHALDFTSKSAGIETNILQDLFKQQPNRELRKKFEMLFS